MPRIAAFLVVLLFSSALHAADPGALAARDKLIHSLLMRLSEAQSFAEAQSIEKDLATQWQRLGSPSVDLLMERGLEAMRDKDLDRAFYYFNELAILAPGYAGGWEWRSVIYLARGDRAKALADLEESLRLEPRNFFVMRRLAGLLFEFDRKDEALELYRRSLALDPWLDDPARGKAAADEMTPGALAGPGRGIGP